MTFQLSLEGEGQLPVASVSLIFLKLELICSNFVFFEFLIANLTFWQISGYFSGPELCFSKFW